MLSWMLGYSEVMSIALLMVLPALGGLFVDSWLKLSPWFLIVGAVVGLVLGFHRLLNLPGVSASSRGFQSGKSSPPKVSPHEDSPTENLSGTPVSDVDVAREDNFPAFDSRK